MPSLRKRVTTYLRQLSFSAEPRDRIGTDRTSINKAGCSIARYIEGDNDALPKGPVIYHGKTPQSLPDLPIDLYPVGAKNVTAACTGPGEGLTSIQRSCLHLSAGPDIDFIDKIPILEDTKPVKENELQKATIKSHTEITDQIHNSNDLKDLSCNNQSNKDTISDSNKNLHETKKIIAQEVKDINNKNDSVDEEQAKNISVIKPIDDNKAIESATINNSDTDSQSSADVSLNIISDSKTELSKKEKEKLRLKNLPKYECRRTKTLSETVLTRPRRNIKPSDKTQSIVLVTKTLQISSDADSVNNKILQCTDTSHVTEEHTKIQSESQSSENDKTIHTDETNASIELDLCNSNIQKETKQSIKAETLHCVESPSETIAGVECWNCETDHAYGISLSLYEHNPLLGDRAGQPIADCFGLVARENAAALALADGVNWGNGAKLAACSAVHGCLSYLNKAIFGLRQEDASLTTHEVFISLLRSFWEAHACIIESGGALCTLTAAVILPLSGKDKGRSVVCVCNVGDSLAYVYSHVYGVREITQGSHDIYSMRDMRDALGALGPVNGTNPELNNLTLSMTIVEPGDLVFLTSDGISDNFDPVVGRFAEPIPHSKDSTHLKSQSNANTKIDIENKTPTQSSKAGISRTGEKRVQSKTDSNLNKSFVKTARTSQDGTNRNSRDGTQCVSKYQADQKLQKSSSHANKPSLKTSQSVQQKKSVVIDSNATRPKYSRSHTTLGSRNEGFVNPKTPASRPAYNRSMSGPEDYNVPKKLLTPLPRSKNGLPLVNGPQRHDLTLLRIADLLNFGINGMLKPCTTSKALCKLLIDFVQMITTGKRKMLEEKELYYSERNGLSVELTRSQQKYKRREWIEKDIFKALPGKLDHASVVAFTVGAHNRQTAYRETDF